MSELLFTKRFAARAENLKRLRQWVKEVSLTQGLTESRVQQIIIGVNEACMNIIKHAYKNTAGDIILNISKDNDSINYQLTDFAQPMDCAKIKSRRLDDLRPGGLGVYFIENVMDEVEYVPGDGENGNRVCMRVKINKD